MRTLGGGKCFRVPRRRPGGWGPRCAYRLPLTGCLTRTIRVTFILKNTNSGEFFHPGFVGTQGEVGVGDRVSLWGCPQWGLPALRSNCPGSPRFCSPLQHGGASSPGPVGALAVPRSPGHVWSPGGKHVPALEELLFVGGHEAGPLVPAERLAQRARAPLRVTRPGHGGPACLLAHFRSALQALKKDDGVPWTGMLAIVHSYVTHKTGRTSSGSGRGHPCLQAHPRGARRRLFWAPTLRRGTVGLVLAARPLRRRGGVLGLVHPVGATGSHEQVRLERLRHRPRRLPAPPAPHSPTAADLALSFPVKEEEKQKLLQRGSELQSEHQQLEERDRRLASAVKVRGGGARRGRGEAVVGAAPLAPRGAGPERPHPAAEAPEEGETCPQRSTQGVSRWRAHLCHSSDKQLSGD